MKLKHLTCACCGGDAPSLAQWWNRDTGYGVCGRCVDWIRSRGSTSEEISFSYGVEGRHWFSLESPAEVRP